jgi:hypothetical protein
VGRGEDNVQILWREKGACFSLYVFFLILFFSLSLSSSFVVFFLCLVGRFSMAASITSKLIEAVVFSCNIDVIQSEAPPELRQLLTHNRGCEAWAAKQYVLQNSTVLLYLNVFRNARQNIAWDMIVKKPSLSTLYEKLQETSCDEEHVRKAMIRASALSEAKIMKATKNAKTVNDFVLQLSNRDVR